MAEPFDEFMDLINSFVDDERLGQSVSLALDSDSARIAAIAGVRQHFDESMAPDGTPWAALKFGRPGGSGADKPLMDTARLAAATTATAEGMSLSVLNNRRQAALQHYGGTIVPVNVAFLAIPNTLEAKRHGGPMRPNGPFPRPLHPRINKARTGGALVDDDDEVQYWLTKGPVVIPPRPFIGFSQETIEIIVDIVTNRIMRDLTGGGA